MAEPREPYRAATSAIKVGASAHVMGIIAVSLGIVPLVGVVLGAIAISLSARTREQAALEGRDEPQGSRTGRRLGWIGVGISTTITVVALLFTAFFVS